MLGSARAVKAVPFTSVILVWGVGMAHQPVPGVPIIGVAIFAVQDLKPQSVGIAHHGLGGDRRGIRGDTSKCSSQSYPQMFPHLIHNP